MVFGSVAQAARHPALGPFGSAEQPPFARAQGIAVDQASGVVLVIDAGTNTINRFKADGTPAPFSALGSNVIDGKGGPDAPAEEGLNFAGPGESQIAVDNSGTATDGDIYVTQAFPNAVYIFSRTGEYLGSLTGSASGPFNEACGVSIGPAGTVYVGDYKRFDPVSETFTGEIQKFEPGANPPTNADYAATFTSVAEPCTLAAGAGPSSSALFAANFAGSVYKLDAASGTLVYQVTGDKTTTLAIDPASGHLYTATRQEAPEAEQIREFDAAGEVEAKLVSVTPLGAPGFGVAASASGVFYAAVSANPNLLEFGPLSSVPGLSGERVVSVGTTDANLTVTLNPEGLPTTYRVEYGPTAAYGLSTPERSIGSGEGDRQVATVLENLQPGVTYHWRVVATNSGGAPVVGSDQVFHTYARPQPNTSCPNQIFRSGPASNLFDCRAYELVSPQEKGRGDVLTLVSENSYSTALDQSALEGGRFTFSSYRAAEGAQAAPFSSQSLASRSATGWQSRSLNPPREAGSVVDLSHSLENEYTAFSPDLSVGWLFRTNDPPLSPCAPQGYSDIYRSQLDGGSFDALVCQQPAVEPINFLPELEGMSSDSAHAVFRVSEALTPNASTATTFDERGHERPIFQTYEADGTGALRLISVLSNGKASDLDSSAGSSPGENRSNLNRFKDVFGAVSADGNRVYWSNSFGALYLRDNALASQQSATGACDEAGKACTIAISGVLDPSYAIFQGANPSGTRALYSFKEGPLEGNLYEFDLQTRTSSLIAEDIDRHVVDTSRDASSVAFVSSAATGQEEAEGAKPGSPNLYLRRGGVTRFVGTLSQNDVRPPFSAFGRSPVREEPIFRLGRMNPDGTNLVFRSSSSELSERTADYDNTDPALGKPTAEVYLYDAEAGKLRCISCNPSGASPASGEDEPGAAGVPGPPAAATIPPWQSQLYNPRYLSDDGHRVFFDAFDALSLEDTNGAMDVYEWEEQGAGECTRSSGSYVPASEGCLNLISSGKDPSGSEFLDASQNGSDVFFTTAQSLVPGDSGLVDVYDARVGGGFLPPPGGSAACQGEGCRPSAVAPAAPNPTSERFQGPGNAKKKKCPKGKALRKGKCVARHAHKKKHHGKHRNHGKKKQRAGSNRRAGR